MKTTGLLLSLALLAASPVASAQTGTGYPGAYQVIRNDWGPRLGLGARGTGLAVNDRWNTLGVGGELLYRLSPHLVAELGAEYQRSPSGPVDRTDVPVSVGLRLHLARPDAVLSPYVVVAAGIDVADEDLQVTHDKAFFVEAQIGGGLELRLGSRFAITADLRFDARKRTNDPSDAARAVRDAFGADARALQDQMGAQLRLGAAVYF